MMKLWEIVSSRIGFSFLMAMKEGCNFRRISLVISCCVFLPPPYLPKHSLNEVNGRSVEFV